MPASRNVCDSTTSEVCGRHISKQNRIAIDLYKIINYVLFCFLFRSQLRKLFRWLRKAAIEKFFMSLFVRESSPGKPIYWSSHATLNGVKNKSIRNANLCSNCMRMADVLSNYIFPVRLYRCRWHQKHIYCREAHTADSVIRSIPGQSINQSINSLDLFSLLLFFFLLLPVEFSHTSSSNVFFFFFWCIRNVSQYESSIYSHLSHPLPLF